MTQEEFFDAMKKYFRELHAEKSPAGEIEADTNLFRAGLVDSLGLPVLIRFIEGQLGAPIDLRRVSIESFYTLQRMFADLVQPAARSQS
jgi:acyl carrier protein